MLGFDRRGNLAASSTCGKTSMSSICVRIMATRVVLDSKEAMKLCTTLDWKKMKNKVHSSAQEPGDSKLWMELQ